MKTVSVTVLGLLALTLSISGCQMLSNFGSQTNSFVVTGEIIYVADEPTTEHEFRVTVAPDEVDGTEESSPVEIASGEFKNRKIRLRGTIDFTLPVTLSV